MIRLSNLLTNLFPVWVVAAGIAALKFPQAFSWFSGGWITWGLAVIMLGMGLTLSLDDFRRVLRMPRVVAIGFASQYFVMPSSRPHNCCSRFFLCTPAVSSSAT